MTKKTVVIIALTQIIIGIFAYSIWMFFHSLFLLEVGLLVNVSQFLLIMYLYKKGHPENTEGT